MNRREFIKSLIAASAVAAVDTLDIDRLLWVPGQKKIFIPNTININDIIAVEMNRFSKNLDSLFYRDELFYREIVKKPVFTIREFRVPFTLKTGL